MGSLPAPAWPAPVDFPREIEAPSVTDTDRQQPASTRPAGLAGLADLAGLAATVAATVAAAGSRAAAPGW